VVAVRGVPGVTVAAIPDSVGDLPALWVVGLGVSGGVKDIPHTVKILPLQPGDAIAVEVERPITREQAETLAQKMREEFPDHKVVVLGRGIQLAVIRPTT